MLLATVENCVVQNALAITVKVRILGACERKGIKERSGLRTIMLFILLRYLGPFRWTIYLYDSKLSCAVVFHRINIEY